MQNIQQGLLSNKQLLKSEGFPKYFSVMSEISSDTCVLFLLIISVFVFQWFWYYGLPVIFSVLKLPHVAFKN